MNGFAERLAEAIELSLQTRQDVAETLGVDKSTITRWCSGTLAMPTKVDRLLEIADVVGVSIHWLVTGEGERRPKRDYTTEALRIIERIAHDTLAGARPDDP